MAAEDLGDLADYLEADLGFRPSEGEAPLAFAVASVATGWALLSLLQASAAAMN